MKLTKNPAFLHYFSKFMGILLFVLKYMFISLLLKMINGFSRSANIMASPFKIRNEVDKCKLKNSSVYLGSSSVSSAHNNSHGNCISFSQFEYVSDSDLLDVIRKCPNKSCSLDVMPTWTIKQHIELLLPNLTRIVNMSASLGIFPQELRKALNKTSA